MNQTECLGSENNVPTRKAAPQPTIKVKVQLDLLCCCDSPRVSLHAYEKKSKVVYVRRPKPRYRKGVQHSPSFTDPFALLGSLKINWHCPSLIFEWDGRTSITMTSTTLQPYFSGSRRFANLSHIVFLSGLLSVKVFMIMSPAVVW